MEKQVTIALLILFLFGACQKENRKDCFTSFGKETKEKRDLTRYNVVQITDHLNLTIKPGRQLKAEISTGKNMLPLIQCEVIDDTLFIENTATCNWVRNYDNEVNVTIYTDSLTGINNYSTGKLIIEDTIRCSDVFTFAGKGMNGEVDFTIKTKRLNFYFFGGAGTAYVHGVADVSNIYNNSIGYIEADDLYARETIVNHKGTGEIDVYSSEILRGWIYQSGDVIYSGNPTTVNVEEFGTGRLIEK